MTELRRYRCELNVTQTELARELRVPVNSLRMWDSGLRPTPDWVVQRAKTLAESAARDREPVTLPQLAETLNVHVRTLQAAARTGRLDVRYDTRSVFGRPLRLATLAAGRAFLETFYRRYGGQPRGRILVPAPVPNDYRFRIQTLRRGLSLSQSDLAELVGAANKAVVYQWEAGKRRPSPVFWDRILRLSPRLSAESADAAHPLRLNRRARSSAG